MPSISVEELAKWRESGRQFVLLDVRELPELERARIPEARHLPMREIPQRSHELDRDAAIAVICHHGERSRRVAEFLEGLGFTDVHNVEGGIDAYAERVDAAVPRY